MNVIGHQAVAQKRKFAEMSVAPQKFQIHQTLAVRIENELARVTTLRDVVRSIYDSDTDKTRAIPSAKYQKTSRLSPGFPGGLIYSAGVWPRSDILEAKLAR